MTQAARDGKGLGQAFEAGVGCLPLGGCYAIGAPRFTKSLRSALRGLDRAGMTRFGGTAGRPTAIGPAAGEEVARQRDLRPLKYLWPYLKPYSGTMLAAGAALVIAAGTLLTLGFGLRKLVDEGFRSDDAALLDQAVLVMLGVVVVLAGASYARFFLVSWLGERVVADIRKAVYSRTLSLSPAFFELAKTGEVLSRLTTDTTVLQVVVGSSASIALRNTLLFFGGLTLLIVTSPKLTGFVLLVVPLVVLPILIFGRRVRRFSRASQDRVADVGAYVEESLGAVRTVQAFTHEAADRAQFGQRVEEAFTTAVERIRARALLTALVLLLVFGAISIILWIGGRDVMAGEISPGELSAFIFYAVIVAGSVGAISEVLGDLQRAAGAAERLIDLLQTEPEITAPEDPLPLPDGGGSLTFDEISFSYPARPGQSALQAISFSVKPGETVALVGPSGAGKSTVFQLLLRFYDPQAGRLQIEGTDLRRVDPIELRSVLALVPQEPVIFSDDVLENTRYGRPEASDEEVRRALQLAGCADFVDALPQGARTFLGEKGVRLSGGQRQRIAIARALLRDPRVLLLDEATSALDSESERLVQAGLERLMRDRTTLVIAHRLSTVMKADRILVIDQGRIVQSGSHAALMTESKGLYARLAALQFDQSRALAASDPAVPPIAAK